MSVGKGRLMLCWAKARRMVLLYVALMFGFFFGVYGLYGLPWSVAGYAALLSLAAGVALAVWDFARFAARHEALAKLVGRFPTAPLPEPEELVQADYTEIITELEAERRRLEAAGEHSRLDAEEYYTLWAHQIKTPLAAMRLMLQSPGGADSGYVAGLEQELLRTGQYVEMVLQYQRLANISSDLALGRYPLAALARQAAKGCAPLFIYKKLALDLEGVQGSVVTDEKWFCFALEQLLTNAVKYTPRGGVRVYTEAGDVLVVEDTGVGIPPEDLPRVFERGFTGTVGRSERSSTGIGLYLCREVMHRLGFGISIQSVPGKGTQVRLHLAQQQLEGD